MSTLHLFGGPGGWDEGGAILGVGQPIFGIELNEQTVATAVAAGHQRLHTDVRDLDPRDFPDVTGCTVNSPCPTFSPAGKRSGLGHDFRVLLDVITHAGAGDCDCAWPDIEASTKTSSRMASW